MRKYFYILVMSMTMVLFSALSVAGQVNQVSKPGTTSTSKPKKSTPAAKTNKTNKTSTTTTKKRQPSSTVHSTTRTTQSSGSSSSSSSVVQATLNCNANEADIYIDNTYYGPAGQSYGIKTGSHYIMIVAEGYEDYSGNFTVTNSKSSYDFSMKKKALQSIADLIDDMVFVHGGPFVMGSTGLDAEYDEKPAHEVILPSFYISKYEVTQELWIDVMGNNPSVNVGDRNPVENITWDDCQMFISQLNAMTGLKFRLPTEAEWEYAARGGNMSQGHKYAGSDSIDDVAWYYDFENQSHEVGGKNPNELGLFDMSGNVQEWCSDWHGPYLAGRQKNPSGPQSGEYRITRGGYWGSEENHCTVTYRIPVPPEDKSQSIGLRLATKTMKPKRN